MVERGLEQRLDRVQAFDEAPDRDSGPERREPNANDDGDDHIRDVHLKHGSGYVRWRGERRAPSSGHVENHWDVRVLGRVVGYRRLLPRPRLSEGAVLPAVDASPYRGLEGAACTALLFATFVRSFRRSWMYHPA